MNRTAERRSAATTMAAPGFTHTGIYILLERLYYEATLPLKLRDATLHRKSMPTHWVANHLFVALKESVNTLASIENGQMCVYYGKPKRGKSAAGAATIEMALDFCFQNDKVQNYPYLFVDAGSDLTANMRRQLGVPNTIKDENVWLTLLFEKLKLVEADPTTGRRTDEQEESDSWWDKLTTQCGGGGSNDFEEYVNQVKAVLPIIVIDDFEKA
jgi:hypothetical protein